MKKIAVLGAGGHGSVIGEIAELNGYSVFFFDDSFPERKKHHHWPVIGNTQSLMESRGQFDGFFIAIGSERIRQTVASKLSQHELNYVTLIHPTAVVSNYATLAEGTVVMAGAIINPFAKVGKLCIINTGAKVDHDCVIGDCCQIMPNAALAGVVIIGEGSTIGMSSCIKQQIKIGSKSTVGAGAVVVKDVPSNDLVIGIPAKSVKS